MFNLALTAGQEYTIGLRNLADLAVIAPTSNAINRIGSLQGRFTWSIGRSIGAVPELSAWAMMILGFALVGGTMRQRPGRVLA